MVFFSILLTILKWIAIIIGIILCLLLFLLLLLLIVPIRYRIDATYYNSSPVGNGSVTYFGHLLRANFHFDKEQSFHYSVKALGFSLASNEQQEPEKNAAPKKKKAKKKNSSNVSKKNETKKNQEPTNHVSKENIKESSNVTNNTIKASKDSSNETVTKVLENKKEEGFIKSSENSNEENKSKDVKTNKFNFHRFWEKLKEGIHKPFDFFKKIHSKIKTFLINLKNKLYNIKTKKDRLIALWQAQITVTARSHIKKYILFLLKHCKPSKCNGSFHFGFEDPALTGKILGYLSMFYAFYGPHFKIQPDFNTPCLEGEIHIKGHIHLLFIAFIAIRVFCDKYIRKTYKRFNQIIGGN